MDEQQHTDEPDEHAGESGEGTGQPEPDQSEREQAQPEQSEPEQAEPEQAESDRQWYVLKVQSNRERSIRESLLRGIRREGLEEFFGEIIIPTEKVVETKGGRKRTLERKLFPGYMMINMVLNDETWYLVRDTNGVGDFTGAAGKPIAMAEEEIASMLGRVSPEAEPTTKVNIDLVQGEAVKIKDGPFESFEGAVEAIDEEHGKITVLVEIFGRSTPTELEYWQVEKV